MKKVNEEQSSSQSLQSTSPSDGTNLPEESEQQTSDIYSPRKRSQVMSAVRRNDTLPERMVRRFLFAHGFRFRKNDARYPGRPDVVPPRYRTVIFVHGCFWHGHPGCKKSKLPVTRRRFWSEKIAHTRERDFRDIAALESTGWNIIIIWECELRNKSNRVDRLDRLIEQIRFGEADYSETPCRS